MRRKNLDLLIALGIAVVNVIWAFFALPANQVPLTVISVILSLPLVLAVPGYALTEAIFPARSLEIVQRLTFNLAFSLAVTILSGFALNVFPVGLRALPWAGWLGLLTVIFSLLAYFRRRAKTQEETTITIQQQPQRFRVQISAIVLFSMAILVVVLSLAYSIIGAEQQSHPGFTNLWVVPVTQAGNTCAVGVGMQSFELASAKYRVVITANKAPLAHWDVITLTPKQQWTQIEAVPVGTNTSLIVLVQIYRLDQPQTVYRHVDLTFHVAPTTGTVKQCSISSVFPSYRELGSGYHGNRSI